MPHILQLTNKILDMKDCSLIVTPSRLYQAPARPDWVLARRSESDYLNKISGTPGLQVQTLTQAVILTSPVLAGPTLGFFVNERLLLSIILNKILNGWQVSPPQNKRDGQTWKKTFKSPVTPLNLIHEWGTHFQHLINRLCRLIFLSNSNMKSLFFAFRERFLFLLSSAETVGVSLELNS